MLHVCMLEYTVTDHGSILVVNKFYACTNLVKFIFKSFVSCSLQFQAFYVRHSTVYRSIFEKLIYQKVETARLLAHTCLRLVEFEHTFCAFCFCVVLLLTLHSAQKFYLLILFGHWLLLQLVAPKGAVFRDLTTICQKLFLCGRQLSAVNFFLTCIIFCDPGAVDSYHRYHIICPCMFFSRDVIA